MPSPMPPMYTMTRGPTTPLPRPLAGDRGDRHISVNAVAPGFTDTEMNDWFADPAAKAWAAAQGIQGRVGRPDDVGDIIAFLASDDARWINGQVLDATGGGLLGVSKMTA